MASVARPSGFIFRPGAYQVLVSSWISTAKLDFFDIGGKTPKSGLGFGLKFLAQDAGADESDQAIMSIANYPYSFKVCHWRNYVIVA